MGSRVVTRSQEAATGNGMICSPQVGGTDAHTANETRISIPTKLGGQNLKDKTKPTKTHVTNQHSNLCSR